MPVRANKIERQFLTAILQFLPGYGISYASRIIVMRGQSIIESITAIEMIASGMIPRITIRIFYEFSSPLFPIVVPWALFNCFGTSFHLTPCLVCRGLFGSSGP